MARIRTVKPSFFRHYELYQAEQETGLPLRVAYEGLWTVADRRGRFCWCPHEIKLDVLPYDELDFSHVLDALTTRGFIVKYTCNGKVYGYIPTFEQHQVINNRESESVLPEPPAFEPKTEEIPPEDHASATRHDLAQAEGEREGEEELKEKSKKKKNLADQMIPLLPPSFDTPRFRKSLSDYEVLRKANSWPIWKPVTIQTNAESWSLHTESEVYEALQTSIKGPYRGIFPKHSGGAPPILTVETFEVTEEQKAKIEEAIR